MQISRLHIVVAIVASNLVLVTPVAHADLSPVGAPTFDGSISQDASGGLGGLTWYGARVTVPVGLDGAYIVSITGLGALDHALTALRNHPGGSPGPEIIEGIWAISGGPSFTATLEVGDAISPPVAPAAYVGHRLPTWR